MSPRLPSLRSSDQLGGISVGVFVAMHPNQKQTVSGIEHFLVAPAQAHGFFWDLAVDVVVAQCATHSYNPREPE